MKIWRRLHLLTLVIVCLSFAASVRAADWQIVASPSQGSGANSLSAVAAAGDSDVWAVGWAFNQSLSAYRTLIEHWNGSEWSIVRSPNATTGYNLLNGLAVLASNNAWAVGQAATGNNYQTLVEHWNGRAWKLVPSPNVAGSSCNLQAVHAISPTDIWAVGSAQSANFNNQPLAIHWNGTVWSIVPTPTIDDDILFAIDAVSTNDVWAVGRSFQEAQTLTMHWNGTQWTVVPSPNGIGDNILFGVAAVATNDVWAVGAAGSLASLSLHWDGTAWSLIPMVPFNYPINNQVLVGVVALASNNIWTAGQMLNFSVEQTLSEQWNGSGWVQATTPNVDNSNNRLHGIAVTPNGTLWAVGTTGVFAKPERTFTLRKTP